MSKKFSVPFNNSLKYVDKVITPYAEHIDEVYFSLPPAYAGNARGILAKQRTTPELCDFVSECKKRGIHSNLVINSGFSAVSSYLPEEIQRLKKGISELYDAGLRRLTSNNPFLLRTGLLQRNFPEMEFVASVNLNADTLHKVEDLVSLFKFSEIVIDRAFNKEPMMLRRISNLLKKRGIRRKLLVNEGCLLGCPFKNFHDQLIGQTHYYDYSGFADYTVGLLKRSPDVEVLIPGLVETYACGDIYQKEPWRLFASPIIRPEDLGFYDEYADSYKIAGRTGSTEAIIERIEAYATGSFDGSLPMLVDSMWLSKPIPNKGLDLNFTLSCNKICSECNACRNYYEKVVGTDV